MANDEFKLPGSSLGEIEKIVEAYSQKGGAASNSEVAQLAGIDGTTISRNNGFLANVGIIQGGNKKEVTELGKQLGHALHHEQGEDVKTYWQEAVSGSSFLSEQLTAVRVQKGVKTEDLSAKILYNSGAKKNQFSETGARSVVAVLIRAGLLKEEDGKY